MNCACFISLHDRTEGNLLSHVVRPAMLLFLNVSITRYSAFTQMLCGSNSCILMFYSSRYFWTALEATLSMMLNTVLKPLFVRYVMFSSNVAIVEVSVQYFTGVYNIVFDGQSYSTNIDVFPTIDIIGNFPV